MFKTRFISMLVLLAAVATGAYAAVPDKVYYRVYDYSDGKLTYTDNEIAGTGVTEVTSSTTEWANGTYVVPATTTISSRITVTGTVNLIILDGAELTAQKGITVSNSNTLNIYMGNSSNSIQSTGKLTATAYLYDDGETFEADAGIGGWDTDSNSDNEGCGTVTIHGGTILVNKSDDNSYSAGIGNSGIVNASGGNITIYYSHVTAYSNQYASAIGVGYSGSGGTVAIYGGEVNAIVTNNPNRNGINASLTVGKDVQVYALSGTRSPDVDLSGQTNVAPEGGGQVTTFNRSMFTRYTGPAPASPVTGYSVSLKEGTDDATNWQGKAGEGDYRELPLTGLEAGTAVSVKYSGTKLVKSVKAVKKAPAGPPSWKLTLSSPAKDLYITANGGLIAQHTLDVASTEFTVEMPELTSQTVNIVATDGSDNCWYCTQENMSFAIGQTYQSSPTMTAVGTSSSAAVYKMTGAGTIPADKTVVLSGVTFNGQIACSGNATMILLGSNTVTAATNYAAIKIGGSGTTLTITGSGSLTAQGGSRGAGIGTDCADAGTTLICGNIVINGGTVTATGGQYGAGIGTGRAYGAIKSASNTCGDITINGGTVTATGGTNSAGIGTGLSYKASNTCGAITIGTGVISVTAEKSSSNPGPNSIGKGDAQNGGTQTCGTITIGGDATTYAAGVTTSPFYYPTAP